MKVLGIDEAGRGPIIGPMVMCGYLIDSRKKDELKESGVKDSKMLSPARREYLFGKLMELADDFIVVKLSAKKLTGLMNEKNLNKIEIDEMAKMIDLMNPDKIIIDSPEANTKRFADKIRAKLSNKNVVIVAENYADKKYPVVSAASIVAKVVRDREVKKIEKKLGKPIGSGYPSDEITIKYLEELISSGKDNDYIRKKWITYKRLKNKYSQKKLSSFGGSDEETNDS